MKKLLLILCLLISTPAWAKQLVLVQGYLAKPSSWDESGITSLLNQHGWQFGGEFHYGSQGAKLYRQVANRVSGSGDENRFYQVYLPTEASVRTQAFYLAAYLQLLRKLYPQQPLILVGHSAGGVVARYVMLRNPQLAVSQLITIASPHLGTDSAEFGKLVGDSPLALFAPLVGAGILNRSQSLYTDLLPEMPHRFLYWLNRQPHPDAEYVSIARDRMSPQGGDFIVPERSQYLENVYALKGRATSYVVPGTHELNWRDGRLILDLVNERRLHTL
jgi:pimeloyl-ACP methyl ester carboxylesterase